MSIEELLNIIGFEEHNIVNKHHSYDVTFLYKNYKLVRTGNTEDDDILYTLTCKENGNYGTLDVFGRRLNDKILNLWTDKTEPDIILILKEEFNNIMRKYKISEINKLNN